MRKPHDSSRDARRDDEHGVGKRDADDKQGWRPPTRRAFVAMLGAAAASLALRDKPPVAEPPRSTWAGKTRWIGHC